MVERVLEGEREGVWQEGRWAVESGKETVLEGRQRGSWSLGGRRDGSEGL